MPIGGVIHNCTAMWLWDNITLEGVDLDFETHCCDCPNACHDNCWCPTGQETIIIGFVECEPNDKDAWFSYTGEMSSFGYKLDPDAEYSAISHEINTQVVRSKWVKSCPRCSPCYPGQGDLDNKGVHETYCLPPDLFDEELDDFPVNEIRALQEA